MTTCPHCLQRDERWHIVRTLLAAALIGAAWAAALYCIDRADEIEVEREVVYIPLSEVTDP